MYSPRPILIFTFKLTRYSCKYIFNHADSSNKKLVCSKKKEARLHLGNTGSF